MYARRISLSGIVFASAFLLQEAVFDQIKLPLGGFSFFLIFALCWAAFSTPEVGAISGFMAGFLMDLSPTSDGPIGQWTLILIVVGFGIAFLRYGDDSLRGNPLSLIVLVASAVVVSLLAYLVLGALLGLNLGTTFQVLKNIIGNGLWTLAIAPLVLPIVSRLHRAILDTRETL
ncbi:MAG: rod shape-determining protein MreD [Actinomycetes bacterium]|nr:rod shape-determining protein MreD [Actinomycetota bacterium]